MARQKRDTVTDDGLFEIGPDELDAVLAGLPSEDSVISLWRLLPQGRPSYVSEFSPSDFSIEAVKNSFGGGSYKYVAKSNGGIVKSGQFSVEGEAKTRNKPVYKRYVNGKLVFAKEDEADVIVSETARGLNPADRPINNESVIYLLLSEIKAMREEMRRPPEISSKKELLEEMMMFKNLFSTPQPNPVGDFSKMAIDLIKQGMDVANAAESGGPPWIMMLLDKVAPMVQDVLKMVNRQQGMQTVGTMPSEPINREQPAITEPQKALTGFDAVAEDLKFYLPAFIRSASSGTDPAILVDMTLPNIPQDKIPAVIGWLQSENWFNDLSKLHPAISAQANWWIGYRGELLEALSEPQESHEGIIEQ